MGPYSMYGGAAGAGVGLLEYMDALRNAKSQRGLQSTREATSPFTGIHGEYVQNPSLLNEIAGGALSGAAFGQNLQKSQSDQALAQAQADTLNSTLPPKTDPNSTDQMTPDQKAIQNYNAQHVRSPASLSANPNSAPNGGQLSPYQMSLMNMFRNNRNGGN